MYELDKVANETEGKETDGDSLADLDHFYKCKGCITRELPRREGLTHRLRRLAESRIKSCGTSRRALRAFWDSDEDIRGEISNGGEGKSAD